MLPACVLNYNKDFDYDLWITLNKQSVDFIILLHFTATVIEKKLRCYPNLVGMTY